jgi:acylphosphatase
VDGGRSRQRRTVHYNGRVQGVGFRFTTERIAGEFAVDGFVKNLPDGRVLVVVEGEPKELDRFLAEIHAEMAGNIRTVAVEPGQAKGEFSGFHVRY